MTNEFKLIHLIQKEHFVLDSDKNGIYNAFMVCKPGNKLLLDHYLDGAIEAEADAICDGENV